MGGTAARTGPAPRYASPVDYDAYGLYGPGRGFDKGKSFQRKAYRLRGRITADGSSGYPAATGRYHLYISWGCPWAQRTAIVRKLNERVYTHVNNGPYRVAGATAADDYEDLRRAMVATLEELDERLAGRRYLFGGEITEADVRLWPTLARFDTTYNPLAGVTERHLTAFPNLWGCARDLYRLPAFRETTDFSSFGGLVRGPKPTFVQDARWRITVEPRLADWDEAPDRDRLGQPT
jgi:glutathionyl-hydroquinone reductase